MQRILIYALLPVLFGLELVASYRIEEREVQYSTEIKISAFTENKVPISNPVSWKSIAYLPLDGSFIRKGDIVVKIDTEENLFDLKTKELDLEIIEVELQTKLDQIDNKENAMKESLDKLNEQLEIQKAQLEKYLSIPREEDIRMSQGRLKVAEMNMEAAVSDLDKAKSRLEKKMISPAEYEKAQFEYYDKRALYEYAKADLELTELKTPKNSLNRIRLQIESIELEKEKLIREIEDFQAIAEIQRKNATTRKNIHLNRIQEIKQDIENSTITTPVDGYVSLEEAYGELVSIGQKHWKTFRLMNIEDISSLSLKGDIDEKKRQFYQVGDIATVQINGQNQVFKAKIKTIGNLARDKAEKDTTDWADVGKKYGIKVHDLTFEIVDNVDWLKPGMQGSATIVASNTIRKPAIPLKYLHNEDGILSIFDGSEHHEVTGFHNQGWFYFDSDEWLGKTVAMGSTQRKKIIQEELKKTNSTRFEVSGEMKPANSIDIITGNIPRSSKISWLIPEETQVTKGDTVAKISNQDLRKDMNDAQTKLEKAQGELEEVLKQQKINERESKFKLKKQKNELEIAEINYRVTNNSVDSSAYIQASLNFEQARLKLENWQNQVNNEKAKTLTSRSPLEIQKMELNLQKAQLQLEKAEIALNQVKKGQSPIAKNKAKLDLLIQQNELDVLKESVKLEEVRSRVSLNSKERSLYWNERHMNRMNKRKEAMTVIAPANGIIRYSTTWISGGIGKVSEGTSVRRRQSILSLPDYSKMFLSVDVPEQYYSQTHIGQKVDIEIPSMNNTYLTGKITKMDVLFTNKSKPENDQGLYSSHEPLGEVNFTVKITVDETDIPIKPGAVGIVSFPFRK